MFPQQEKLGLQKHGKSYMKNNGFSLIEVLMAIFIGSLILGSVLVTVSMGMTVLKSAEDYTEASTAGQQVMEELLHETWDTVTTKQDALSYRRTVNFSGDTTRFKSNIYVATSPAPLNKNLCQITVKIYWKGKKGDNDLTLSTLRVK